ncbi:hypothetical protein GCM10022205_45910 [Spinactinospora alkalitolerans]
MFPFGYGGAAGVRAADGGRCGPATHGSPPHTCRRHPVRRVPPFPAGAGRSPFGGRPGPRPHRASPAVLKRAQTVSP